MSYLNQICAQCGKAHTYKGSLCGSCAGKRFRATNPVAYAKTLERSRLQTIESRRARMTECECCWCGSVFFRLIKSQKYCGPVCSGNAKSLLESIRQQTDRHKAVARLGSKRDRLSGAAKLRDAKYRATEKYRESLRRRRSTPKEKLRHTVQRAIRAYVGAGKGNPRTEQLSGCPISFLVHHIESQFTGGMTWKNYGRVWHLDHIVPLSSFDLTNGDEVQRAFHWSNLQPLKAEHNLEKSFKIDNAQLGLLMKVA